MTHPLTLEFQMSPTLTTSWTEWNIVYEGFLVTYLVSSKRQRKETDTTEPENRLNSMNTESEAKKLQLM